MGDKNSDSDVLIAKNRAARQQQWAVQRMFALIGLLTGIVVFGSVYSFTPEFPEQVRIGIAGLGMFSIMFPVGMLGKYQGEKTYKRARARYGLTDDSVQGPIVSPRSMKLGGIIVSVLGVPTGYSIIIGMNSLYDGPSDQIVVMVMSVSAFLLLVLTGVSIFRVGRQYSWYFSDSK